MQISLLKVKLSNTTWWHDIVNIVSGNGFLPIGTKLLPSQGSSYQIYVSVGYLKEILPQVNDHNNVHASVFQSY